MNADENQPARVLLLGDPRLREQSARVADHAEGGFLRDKRRLHATLAAFRAAHGFGRAIAAPQIGVARRFIALNLGEGPFTMINPEITWCSPETFTLWDDCMSFPFLLVRVRRHRSVTVRYVDDEGETKEMAHLDPATSELLQHEIDHLDGVLAVDHALDRDAIVSREVFEARREWFEAMVDGA